MDRLKAGLFGVLLGLVSTLHVRAETPAPAPTAVLRPLANVGLAPALLEAAEREHISLFKTSGVTENSSVGDSAVFWVGTVAGEERKQWLIQLRRGAITPEEQKAHRAKDITKYLSWGPVIVFKSEVDALDLWIAGPVETPKSADSKKQKEAEVRITKTRVYVPRDFLQLGLDDSERASSSITRRAKEIKQEDPGFKMGHIYAMHKPIRQENINYAKPVAARIGFTPEMERAWSGGFVALQSFYELASRVPALKDIADVAFKRPAVWKLSKLAFGAHFKTNFGGRDRGFVDSGKLGFLPVPMASFDVPFSFQFDKELIVSGAMLVTKPAPPLDVSAGILAILAFHPTDKTRAVELRAIASTRGADKPGGMSVTR